MTLTVGPPQPVGVLDASPPRSAFRSQYRARGALMKALGLTPGEANGLTGADLAERLAAQFLQTCATANDQRASDREVRRVLRDAIDADPFLGCEDETPTVRLAEIVAGGHRDRLRVAKYKDDVLDRMRTRLLGALPDVQRPIALDVLAAVAATRIRDQARQAARLQAALDVQVTKNRLAEEQLADARATPAEVVYRPQPWDDVSRAVLTELIEAASFATCEPNRFARNESSAITDVPPQQRLGAAIAGARGLLR